ncbi:serine O-acetyltransferase EpsC [Lichenifustis flavocetrariae]|uniref:serine O-acetyltransferase n=1 Tax=Lichenifustis flavocetrariae TaxID=2949735 RepID=A0AA41YZ99_9HYPH|nr:serine O-acetyltransferase EpsC [Lichenifustis flavocetrariae]MCW6506432.1 serine acetyltransferase [Lichenifustis flavocetrariae]
MSGAHTVMPFRSPRSGSDTTPRNDSMDDVLVSLRTSRDVTHNIRHKGQMRRVPSPQAVTIVLDKLSAVLFPTHYGQADLNQDAVEAFVEITLREALILLHEQVLSALLSTPDQEHLGPGEAQLKAASIVRGFAARLAEIRGDVVGDVVAAYDGDPAATGYSEILLSYPGMIAVLHYRLARALYLLGAKLLARVMSQIAHSKTAIDIHPGATIGSGFFIDHGTGVVIGETTVIGDRVRLYQGVTLGAKSFQTDGEGRLLKGHDRHPIIEDDVVIYAGATILGRIVVGKGSVIGGNVWLTEAVPPGSRVVQARMRNEHR